MNKVISDKSELVNLVILLQRYQVKKSKIIRFQILRPHYSVLVSFARHHIRHLEILNYQLLEFIYIYCTFQVN